MTDKLVVIINSLKVLKIKKILLYEMKFLVPNYGCLHNPLLGGYRPQIPILSVLDWICWTPPWKKFLHMPLFPLVGLHRIQLLSCCKVTCAYALLNGDICGQEVTRDTADLGTWWRWVVNPVIQPICLWNTRLRCWRVVSLILPLLTGYYSS